MKSLTGPEAQSQMARRKNELVMEAGSQALAAVLDQAGLKYQINKGWAFPHCPAFAPNGFRIATFYLSKPKKMVLEVSDEAESPEWVAWLKNRKIHYVRFSESALPTDLASLREATRL